MKTKNLVIAMVLLLSISSIFTGCKKEDNSPKTTSSIIPAKFSVDIPTSLNNSTTGKKSATTVSDTIKGNDVYGNLRLFIAIGESGAKFVEEVMVAIAVYGINQPIVTNYVSNDDHRVKNLVVTKDVTFDDKSWQYKLLITDAESESNPDGGKALEVFWNLNPTVGIAIARLYNCNRVGNANSGDATFRIDYSEKSDVNYDKTMTVQISGIPLPSASIDRYAVNNLKMFVGKKNDIVDVYGNSNHPNAWFFTQDSTGFNWAFVASAFDSKNIGVAEVGIPPCSLNDTSRTDLLDYYSIKNVFTREINYVFPGITQISLDAYLANTVAPGYFSNHSFLQAGTLPSTDSTDYKTITDRLLNMKPYNPKDVNGLVINF